MDGFYRGQGASGNALASGYADFLHAANTKGLSVTVDKCSKSGVVGIGVLWENAPSPQHTLHVGDNLRQVVGLLFAKATRSFRRVAVAENVERVDAGRSRPNQTLDFIWGEGLHWANVDTQQHAAGDVGTQPGPESARAQEQESGRPDFISTTTNSEPKWNMRQPLEEIPPAANKTKYKTRSGRD